MLKEQKKRKRYKHSGFDGTTLICCAIGVVVSVNSCNFVNEKIYRIYKKYFKKIRKCYTIYEK